MFNVPLAVRAPLTARPNDPLFPSQWALAKAAVTNVWGRGVFGYPNVPCAVYDTGCHLTHEDLAVNVQTRVSALNSDPDPEDHHGHGSHCLGIMGADANNGKGVSGVGQVANLTSIRGPISYWQEGDSILDGFQYALDHGIRIVSCSFGSYGYDGAEKAPQFVDSGAGSGMAYPEVPPISAPKPEFYHVREGWASDHCRGDETVPVQAPMDSRFELRVPANGAWRVHYTTDGTDPTVDSPLYAEPFVIPGTCVVKAIAFAEDYAPSPCAEVSCRLDILEDEREQYLARLTVVGGRKRAGTYGLEDFVVRADPPPERKRFSHWKVTGPLVLEDPRSPEVTFRWWQGGEAVTLEAVYTWSFVPKVLFR